MKIRFGLVVYLICALYDFAVGGDGKAYPEVGKPCPDVVLHNIAYYKKKQARISDFRGQWLVLDFWDKTCGSCVESFPRTSAMQQEFKGRVQFMLVGIQDPEGEIEDMYKVFREKEELSMPCDFDSLLSNEWGIYNCPHIVILDDKGIVRGVTNSLDSTDIRQFLGGGNPVLVHSYLTEDVVVGKDSVNFDSLYSVKPNEVERKNGILSRSLFTSWNPISQESRAPRQIDMNAVSSDFPRGSVHIAGLPLSSFYFYAFLGVGWWTASDTALYGKFSQQLILNVKDSSVFQFSYKGEGKNLFAYELSLPTSLGNKEEMEIAMQNDLARTFGFKASIENRLLKCWTLVARSGADSLLKTKGTRSGYSYPIPRARVTITNKPEKELAQFVGNFLRGTPVYDETNLVGNIDISIDYIGFDELKESLNKYGLELVSGYKEIKAIVISDN